MSKVSEQASHQSDKPYSKQKVSGVILIDKPIGMTSQQVVSKVKYLFQSPIHDSKKAGHTGTLDPMATGLLPICLGEATKFSHYQLDADKSYQATILLGQQTDTGDADGKIIAETAVPIIDNELLTSIAQQFMGAQQQIPPMYSALKKDGKKLYEYARAGIEVERAPRDITIKSLDLTMLSANSIELTVTCTKGTYVRVLGEDIAKALDTLGHLTALRRLDVGKFSINNAISLPELEALEFDNRFVQLLPIDACIYIAAQLVLDSEQCERIKMGQRLNVIEQLTPTLQQYIIDNVQLDVQKTENANIPEHELPIDIRLIDTNGQFLGLGAVSLNGRLQPKKLIQR
ncbi:tRNA pseudouridine(55) synthase TruB [Psychrobacter sp. M13]|uniref:tRNA pseudouridine(55) synthase TruB n=1 Tax=Psychrobacter sp. M13 TaxID=3067275 RepID=UPI00273BF40D|nr:tRNA pseudouridine(55) synthase TruB [Psychrobacter sp. M13]WLP94625.1 tRNA pseudouridine(55) synthase TruB [Psychrobacter sp. M13]